MTSTKAIVLVAAMDEERAIGKSNKLPWRIPEELQRFTDLSMGNAVIMGRATYLSIGRPLRGRTTIVMSRSAAIPGVAVGSSLNEALALAASAPGPEIIIGGGSDIYRAFLPIADRLELTRVHGRFDGDRFFPEFDPAAFTLSWSRRIEGEIPFTFTTYIKAIPKGAR